MESVDISQAKAHLSRLLDRILEGEVILISRRGKPVKLVPVSAQPRLPGRLKRRIRIASDFDDPLPNSMEDTFRGKKP